MATLHLSDVETAVRSSWGPDTFLASEQYMDLRPDLPSRGQCGTTALVVQGLFGGGLMVADVEYEGVVTGVHYCNVTSGGIELDLTNDQFAPGEKLLNPREVLGERNTAGPGEEPYQALKRRVERALEEMRTRSE